MIFVLMHPLIAVNLDHSFHQTVNVLYKRHGIAALRSVADMLTKSTQDSIKAIAKCQRFIDDANRSPQ